MHVLNVFAMSVGYVGDKCLCDVCMAMLMASVFVVSVDYVVAIAALWCLYAMLMASWL